MSSPAAMTADGTRWNRDPVHEPNHIQHDTSASPIEVDFVCKDLHSYNVVPLHINYPDSLLDSFLITGQKNSFYYSCKKILLM